MPSDVLPGTKTPPGDPAFVVDEDAPLHHAAHLHLCTAQGMAAPSADSRPSWT